MHNRNLLIGAGLACFAVITAALALHTDSIPFRSTLMAEVSSAIQPTQPLPDAPTTTPQTSAHIPIIVVHIVRPSYPSDDASVRRLALTPETFDADLAHLQAAGYTTISFRDLEQNFSTGKPLPSKPIIISFDDGWSDQYQYAFPIMQKYHDTATFFVFTNAIGRNGYLSWDNLKTLVAAGMTIGDHSKSHPFLTKITDPNKLWDEISGSKTLLENQLGSPVTEFAYPFGQYNANILSLIQKAGFQSARGDYWGGDTQTSDHIYELSARNAPTTTDAFIKDYP